MYAVRKLVTLLMLISFANVSMFPTLAQQSNGTPGSPGATTTLDAKQVPAPNPKFGGVIKQKASESTPVSYTHLTLPTILRV